MSLIRESFTALVIVAMFAVAAMAISHGDEESRPASFAKFEVAVFLQMNEARTAEQIREDCDRLCALLQGSPIIRDASKIKILGISGGKRYVLHDSEGGE